MCFSEILASLIRAGKKHNSITANHCSSNLDICIYSAIINFKLASVSQTKQTEITEKVARVTKALELKPAMGIGTGISIARISNGLSCQIKEGEWELNADMPVQVGGTANAPTPGVLGRAALGSCLAIGYMIWAAKLEVPIDNLEVEIQADWDDGGTFGTSEVKPGYSDVRYSVRVESQATEEEIMKVLDAGDKHSPYLDIFSNAQLCRRHVEINGSNRAIEQQI